jgi:HK97 family phage portal protein
MRLFGLSITRAKALQSVADNRGAWFPLVHEPFTGAWQRNMEVNADTALAYSAVYSCVTLIASDIGKLRIRLVEQDRHGIWKEAENPSFSPVLRKPNRYQTRIKFFENWITSKIIHGNTYVLKVRDNRNVVSAMYILDPCRTRVLVADDGSVFYELHRDNLTGMTDETVVVPASEIIHDTMVPLYHPLVGVSPISACGLAALHGLNIQKNSTTFFENGARPSGILAMASAISDERAKQYQEAWDSRYRSGGLGGTAVLGGDWKYIPMTMTAVDAQLIEQLKMTAEIVCSCFKVPSYMIGVGAAPTYTNIEALNQQYYSQCLQTHIESIELLLDEGLDLKKSVAGKQYGTEFDLDDLLRMDTATRTEVAQKSIIGGGMSPNEARKRYHGLGPVKGGESPYLQQQQFSLAALDERDRDKPFSKPAAPPPGTPAVTPEPADEVEEADGDEQQRALVAELYHRAAKFDVRDAA